METSDASTSRRSTSSPSPSSEPSNISSTTHHTPSEETVMVSAPRNSEGDSRSLRGIPDRSSSQLPRNQASGRGGCWTCRLRRKKCDEQRDGDSCYTCKRLTIECLGWGPRRPDWMRDKRAVEKYKAGIKEKLTRAGLIRGQPRTSLVRSRSTVASAQPHSSTPELASLESQPAPYRYSIVEETYRNINTVFSAIPGAPTNPFDNVSTGHSYYQYSVAPSALHTSDPYSLCSEQVVQDADSCNTAFVLPPTSLPPQALASSLDEHVFYYFDHMSSLQPMLVGRGLADMTYSLITQNPKGAVTNAVCALSSLHLAQMKISHGLDSPESSIEQSKAMYFRDEAYFQIGSSKQLRGGYAASDAIAALHLVGFSQLSGGQSPWQEAFSVLCDWLIQSTLPSVENPYMVFNNMSNIDQYIVKATISLDIFTSLMATQPPKFLALIKQLLGNECTFWPRENSDMRKIHMEDFAGLPDNVLLGLAEITALSHWKASESSKGTLSYRELVRRGTIIEQLLRGQSFATDALDEQSRVPKVQVPIEVAEEVQRIVVDTFREAALQYLFTILNGYNPGTYPCPLTVQTRLNCSSGVPEIKASVETVVQSLYRLQPSTIDRSMVFPTFITACLTDDHHQREFLKSRLQTRDTYIGNLPQICMALEAVWQTRDTGGRNVDIREVMKNVNLALLLV
ncbi:hypothetical protein AX15_002005 [Amanita polypyramis BW_CC]|nr:hypothetical protein AX15_002005 [Amanita polypyramis BW_CC]